jgi:hypothetical protein
LLISPIHRSLGAEGGDVSDTIPSRAADRSVDIAFSEPSGANLVLSGQDSVTWNGGVEDGSSGISTLVQVFGADIEDVTLDTWDDIPTLLPSSSSAGTFTTSFKIGEANREVQLPVVPTLNLFLLRSLQAQ